MQNMRKSSLRNLVTLASLPLLLASLAGACTPAERSFEPGQGGSGGAGGSGGSGIVCEPMATESCYSGPIETENVGLCKAGTHQCLSDGTGFGECGGEIVPQPENCLTTKDEACNGEVAADCPTLGDGWLKTYGAMFAADSVTDIAITPDGDIVIVGGFGSMIDFGTGAMASTGSYDIFVAKLDPLGNAIWAKRFGDAASQSANAVAVDAQGNIYVAGAVSGAVDFGNGVLTSAGSTDAFLVKLDANGDAQWSKLFGDASPQSFVRLAITPTNQIVAAGTFTGSVSFGGTALTSTSKSDLVIAKYDSDGFHSVSRRFGGTVASAAAMIGDLALSSTGEPYLTGSFSTELAFSMSLLTSQGLNDIFVAKLNATTFTPLWARSWGDASSQNGFSIATAPNDDVYIAGNFEGVLAFDDIPLQTPDVAARVLYAARISAAGDKVLWAKPFGDATAVTSAARLAVDTKSDTLLIAASAKGTMDFGGGPISSVDNDDPFLAKLNADGSHIASRSLPSLKGGTDVGNFVTALTLLPTGDVIMGGRYHAPFDYQMMAVGEPDLKDGSSFLGRFLP